MTLGALNGFMSSIGYGSYDVGFGREAQGTSRDSSPMPSRPVMKRIKTVFVSGKTARPASQFPNLRGASLMSGHTINYNTKYKKFYIKNEANKVVRKGMSGTVHVPGLFTAGSQWASRNKPPAQAAAEKKVTEKKLDAAKSSGDAAAIAALTAQIAALSESQAVYSGKTDISSTGFDQQTMILLGGGAAVLLIAVVMLSRATQHAGGGGGRYGPPTPPRYGPPARAGRGGGRGGYGGYKRRKKRKR